LGEVDDMSDKESYDYSMRLSRSNSGISLDTTPTPDRLRKTNRRRQPKMKCLRILISHYLATNGGEWDDDTFEEIAESAGLSTSFVMKWYKNRK